MKKNFVVVVNNIRSAHNVGSVFRTADAAGCEKIFLCGITPGPVDRWGNPNAKVLKVSLGAEKFVEWEQVKSTTALLDRLKKEGHVILALEKMKKAKSIFNFKTGRNKRMALVLGNEKTGLSPAVLRRADEILEIPMRGKKESLNVSVAFGIAIFSLTMNA